MIMKTLYKKLTLIKLENQSRYIQTKICKRDSVHSAISSLDIGIFLVEIKSFNFLTTDGNNTMRYSMKQQWNKTMEYSIGMMNRKISERIKEHNADMRFGLRLQLYHG